MKWLNEVKMNVEFLNKKIEKIYKKIKLQYYVYATFYYILNMITIFAALVIGVLAVYYLAGSNKLGERQNILNNPWYNEVLVGVGFYPVLTTSINSFIGFVSGILSFFVVNKKYQDRKIQSKKIQLHILICKEQLSIYKNIDNEGERLFMLYKNILNILEIDKYSYQDLINEDFNETK
ncbi:DUF4231 domain-containing protein [Mycoplasma sp. NEAQ87857]|uniref:DUF4231 domain-containing protein n=1 Tax=Mycoplasma sp. NEAQ87857 TaxID=2683967 RepID=UPI001318ADE7|nr:DUF4231 domain-containing protein [Mycoplasma sp. NEAQ87857]QGZ97635.1 DUF4231 domain-containing protein [Mycoplasma sp. NEAQ87857]